MNFSSLFTGSSKSLPLITLLFFFGITTAIAQSPILPFPAQPPVAQISQPFLQQQQVIVGPASVIQVPQRTYVAPVIQAPVMQTPVVTATVPVAPTLKVASEYEMLNMDLRREMAYQTRIERQVQTNRDINGFVNMMVQSLGTSGWSASWQGTRANAYLTDFYHSGGQHLRLEVESAATGGYQVLLYTF